MGKRLYQQLILIDLGKVAKLPKGDMTMKATVTSINHPNEHMHPFITVQLRRGAIEHLYTYRQGELFDQLAVGDTVAVRRQTNNPYLVLVSDS